MRDNERSILPAGSGPAPIPARWRDFALLAVLLFPGALTADRSPGTLLPEAVRSAAEARVADGHYQSLIIGVGQGSDVEWTRFGRLSGENGPAPDPDTVYEIGSLTKPFTAALLSLAEEEGRLSIEDRVGERAPPDHDLDPRLRDDVALWQLATHVSGLPDTPDDLSPEDPSRLFESYSRQSLWDFLARHPLASQPGEHYNYSNLGYALLGELLAAHYDTPYERLLKERISAPLGLDSTDISPSPTVLDRLAPGFDYDLNSAPSWSWPAFQAAGALHSTPRDLMRWGQAHLAPSDDALGRALRRLYQVQLRLGEQGQAMGLGWQLRLDDDVRTVWHSGRSAGYAAFIGFQPETDRTVVILANTGNTVESLGFAALNPGHEVPPIRKASLLDPQLGALYAGRYRLSPGFVLKVRHTANGLFLRTPARPTLRLYSLDGERFFTRGVDSEVRFLEGEDGSINGMEIRTPGGDVLLAHRMLATETPVPRTVEALDPAQLQAYAGSYRVNGDTEFDLRADSDRLLLTSDNGPALPLYPAADGRFFHRSQPLELHFTPEADGEGIGKLILFRNGYRLEADRLNTGRD